MKNTRMIRREWYASHGICVECGQREAEPHKRKCWECSEKKAEYNRKYNANMTPEQKEKNSIRHKKMYESRKATGICVYCGKKPAVSGKVACVMCAKRDAKRHMEKNRKMGMLPRCLFGDGYHCVICGKDIDNGNEVEVDFDTGVITNVTKGCTYKAEPFPEFIKDIINKGGLLNSLKK